MKGFFAHLVCVCRPLRLGTGSKSGPLVCSRDGGILINHWYVEEFVWKCNKNGAMYGIYNDTFLLCKATHVTTDVRIASATPPMHDIIFLFSSSSQVPNTVP